MAAATARLARQTAAIMDSNNPFAAFAFAGTAPNNAARQAANAAAAGQATRNCQLTADSSRPEAAVEGQARRPVQQEHPADAAGSTSASASLAATARRSSGSHRANSSRGATAAAAGAVPAANAAADTAGGGSSSNTAKRQRKAYAALAGPPKGLPEKLGAAPLRLILVGHNPSEHAWHTGHYYSNPSNRMWRTLIAIGIAPPGTAGPQADDAMPAAVGVGFTDVGSGQPGTDSSLFTGTDFQRWQSGFYQRLLDHTRTASASIGCSCGLCGAPALVAFTGKRHYLELLWLDAQGQPLRGKARQPGTSVALGRQPPGQLPAGWPLPPDRTEVWVLTSTSGAAPMTNEERERPYRQLAQRLQQVPWPRAVQLRCSGSAAEPAAAEPAAAGPASGDGGAAAAGHAAEAAAAAVESHTAGGAAAVAAATAPAAALCDSSGSR